MHDRMKYGLSYVYTRDVTSDTIREWLPEGVILLSQLPKLGQPTSSVQIHEIPDYAKGRKDSVHRVKFGNMIIPEQSSALTTQPVAIKPVESARHAVREYKAEKYLNKEGEQLAFRTLGFTKTGGNFSTITEFDQGVVSYDNILLQESHKPTEPKIAEALTVAAQTLVILNSKGLVHGDFQVKNTASDINGRTRIIDLTTIGKLHDMEDVSDDILLYAESLTRFGTQLSPVSQQQFDDHFLHIYEKNIPDIFPIQRQLEAKMATSAIRSSLDILIGPSAT
ncbi:hypothetical protein FBF29_01955 [Candidatus Saccharibacteria bacterium oral taxon 488]|nr:hypothetical protein FBF29_01955 [Candidatus Saccharibacteria bacterium oral taxon 488]